MTITISITADDATSAREELAKLLYNCTVAQLNQPVSIPVSSTAFKEREDEKPVDSAPAETAPVKRTRVTKVKVETPVADVKIDAEAVAPAVTSTTEYPAATKEDFLTKLNGLRATFGEGIIPELRKILSEYKTATGETVVQSSQVQAQDFPAIMADFARLEAKKDNDI